MSVIVFFFSLSSSIIVVTTSHLTPIKCQAWNDIEMKPLRLSQRLSNVNELLKTLKELLDKNVKPSRPKSTLQEVHTNALLFGGLPKLNHFYPTLRKIKHNTRI